MLLFSFVLSVFGSAMENVLFEEGDIEKALSMDLVDPIDFALKYFLLKNFKENIEDANFIALSASHTNDPILLLLGRSDPQNGKIFLGQKVRVSLLIQLGEKVSTGFFDNKYDFREMISLSSIASRIDALDCLKNIKNGDERLISLFFYYIDTRMLLLRNVIKELIYLVSKGNKIAACYLGQAYLSGIGVEKDIDKAFEYFFIAKEENKPYALMGMGKILMTDEYKLIDGAISAFNLAKGIRSDAELEYCLHLVTETGDEIPFENKEYLKKAAFAGYLPAVQQYAKSYLEQGQIESAVYSSMSITQYSPMFIMYDEMALNAYLNKDYRKACLIYLFLAEYNMPVATSNSIFIMEKHKLFENQSNLLFNLYKVQSLSLPTFNKKLGDCFYYGRGVEKSLDSAFHSYLASKQYCTDGAYSTAYMYEEGLGIPKNLFEAKRIITKYLYRDSLYLVRFYALARINTKIIMFHYRIPFMIATTACCLLGVGVGSYFLKKSK